MTGPRPPVPQPLEGDMDPFEPEQLVLSDLLNRVLDKGVVISAHVIISVADIDLIQLDLRLLISSVATIMSRATEQEKGSGAELPVRTDPER